jgi:RNA-directed DNA polymerase
MSSHDMKNPNGGVHMGHVIEPPNPNSNLLELVLSRDNMHLAWKRVNSNKGAPGVDDISIKEFPDIIRDKWEGIRESLMEGTYEPSPVLRVEIPKSTGGLPTHSGIGPLAAQTSANVLLETMAPLPDKGEKPFKYRRFT